MRPLANVRFGRYGTTPVAASIFERAATAVLRAKTSIRRLSYESPNSSSHSVSPERYVDVYVLSRTILAVGGAGVDVYDICRRWAYDNILNEARDSKRQRWVNIVRTSQPYDRSRREQFKEEDVGAHLVEKGSHYDGISYTPLGPLQADNLPTFLLHSHTTGRSLPVIHIFLRT